MRPEDLLHLLRQSPFQPFRLLVSTGIAHEVRHPELAMVGRSTLTIEFPAADAPALTAHRRVVIALLHIVQVEFLASTGGPGA